jgi:spore coat polysaccharide biosynthesis protein SpsF (cytidylyltransferase family)
MSSTRFPGKVLRPLWSDKCLLDLQLEGLRNLNVPIVLATTTNSADDKIEKWSCKNHLRVFRGSEKNVLKRFIDCAKEFEAKSIIRVCSDNPFLQFDEIQHFLDQVGRGLDYISYSNKIGTPAIKTHWGLFVEGISLSALEKTQVLIREFQNRKLYQEHVTNFIYENPAYFNVQLENAPEQVIGRDDLRFTIDTDEDFQIMSELLHLLNGKTDVGLKSLVKTVDDNPRIGQKMAKGIGLFTK